MRLLFFSNSFSDILCNDRKTIPADVFLIKDSVAVIIGSKESQRKGDRTMCGRYALEATKSELWERYLLGEMKEDVEERAEIFPTNYTPLIIPGNELVHHKWGLLSLSLSVL